MHNKNQDGERKKWDYILFDVRRNRWQLTGSNATYGVIDRTIHYTTLMHNAEALYISPSPSCLMRAKR